MKRPSLAIPFFDKTMLLLTIGLPLLVVLPFCIWGYPIGHDFEFHMQSWADVAQHWREGVLFPGWAGWANYGLGEPRFIFYPPVSWMLGPAIALVAPAQVVPAVFVWIGIAVAGVSMRILASTVMSEEYATMAAALYACNPYQLLTVYQRAALPEFLASAVFPLLIFFAVQLRTRGWHGTVPLAWTFGFTWLTNAPAGLITTYCLMTTAMALAVRSRVRIVLQVMVSMVGGLALAGFYVIPATIEQKWVNISTLLAPASSIEANFPFSTSPAVYFAFNLVISITATLQFTVFLIAVVVSRKFVTNDTREVWTVLFVVAGVAIVLTLPLSLPVWKALPELQFLQFPWRWMFAFNAAFACVLAATAASRGVKSWVPVMIIVLVSGFWAGQTSWRSKAVPRASESIEAQRGFAGKGEYLPKNATSVQPEVNRGANVRLTDNSADSSSLQVERWFIEDKVFSINAAHRESVHLRLLSYPAWKAYVNGHTVPIDSDATGRVVIPLSEGHSRVRLVFAATADRLVGALVSAITTLGLICIQISFRWRRA